MIFAEMEYEGKYEDIHDELHRFLSSAFQCVEHGLQGDSWIWILDGSEKVTIDTFSSMRHQIKSSKPGSHVQNVIEVLIRKYKLDIYETPEPEGHDDV
jgi:hypothetical protein